jgi:hypothetical protein
MELHTDTWDTSSSSSSSFSGTPHGIVLFQQLQLEALLACQLVPIECCAPKLELAACTHIWKGTVDDFELIRCMVVDEPVSRRVQDSKDGLLKNTDAELL